MAFPVRWAQLWVDLPTQGGGTHPSALNWFMYSGAVTASYDVAGAGAQMMQWWYNGVGQMIHTDFPAEQLTGWLYINRGVNVIDAQAFHIPPLTYPIAPFFPWTHNVTIARIAGTGRSETGWFNIPGVALTDGDGNSLTNLALGNYQTLANTMTTPVVWSGVTFHAAVASYKMSTLLRINEFIVRPRMGRVKRRGRVYTGPVSRVPKPPPP